MSQTPLDRPPTPNPETATKTWWEQQPSSGEIYVMVFLVYAVGSVIALLVKTIHSGLEGGASTMVFGPLLMGATFMVRTWFSGHSLKTGSRSQLLTTHAALCACGLAGAFYVATKGH